MAFNFVRHAKAGRVKKLRKCINQGVFIDAANTDGETALFCCASNGRVKCLEFLLANGANPNRVNVHGMTPLHAAIQSSHVRCVGVLLQYGSDLHVAYAEYPTILAFARYHGDIAILHLIEEFAHDDGMGHHQPAQNYNAIFLTTCASSSRLMLAEEPPSPEGIPLIDVKDLKKPEFNSSFSSTHFTYVDGMWKGNLITVKHAPQFDDSDFYYQCLKKEINLLRQLRHYRFPVAMAVCPDPFCVIMDRFYYSSLSHYLRDVNMEMEKATEFTLVRVMRIILDVAQALFHLHYKQWVHCHVTSHSIFVCDGPRAKLGALEFCERPGEEVPIEYLDSELPWLAPEVLKGGLTEYHNDIYSLAVTFWECLTREVPWSWLTDSNKTPPPPPSSSSHQLPILHGWPTLLRTFLAQCFEEAEHRPTITEFCQNLEDMICLKMPLDRAQLDDLFKEWLGDQNRQRFQRCRSHSLSSRSEILSLALGETYSSLVRSSVDSQDACNAHRDRRNTQERRRSAVVTSLVEEALTTLVHIGLPPTEIHEADIYRFGFKLARDIAELRGLCSLAKQTQRKMWAKVAMATRDLEEDMFDSLAGYEECTFRRKHAHALNLKRDHMDRHEEKLRDNLERKRSLISRHERKNWACYTMLLCELYGILRRNDTLQNDTEDDYEQEAINQSIMHIGYQMRKISSVVFDCIVENFPRSKSSSEFVEDVRRLSQMADDDSGGGGVDGGEGDPDDYTSDHQSTSQHKNGSDTSNSKLAKRQIPYLENG